MISTIGYATNQDSIQADKKIENKFSVQPKFFTVFINEMMPLINPDKNKGKIQAAYLAGSLGILPTIMAGL